MKKLPQDSSAEIPFFNGKVFRDAAITIGLSFVAGFLVVVGMDFRFSMNDDMHLLSVGLSTTLGGIISGLSVPHESMVRHLQAVGFLVWLFELLNVALGTKDFIGFILSLFFVAVYIALGGWISSLVTNPKV